MPKQDNDGRWLKRDGNVWQEGVDNPDDLDWIANEGIRVSRIVAAIADARVPENWTSLRDELLAAEVPEPPEILVAEGPSPRKRSGRVDARGDKLPQRAAVTVQGEGALTLQSNGTVTVTLPLHVTITPPGQEVSTPPGEDLLEKVEPIRTIRNMHVDRGTMQTSWAFECHSLS